MNRELAKRIVIETFESGFNKDKFIKFLKNLLKDFEEKTTFIYRGNYIPDAFEQYISSFERIGKYTDGENEIDLLIVKLKRESSLIRARTAQRNFIAWYLKGSRGGKWKDAALCAFVSPDSEDWRFSLIKIDYKIEETPAGKIKVKEEFTPAKRWSFLVGNNEKSHTAQSRFVPLLERDEKPTLEDLEEAFNIETVTKEFFEKYRELFIRTKLELDNIIRKDSKVKKEFESKNINTVDFAKKLLGQIVFLYFLQKKGWFGVEKGKSWGTGPKDFMRRLFNKEYGDYKNFFNDILEPLFYEALRTDRSWADHYYSRFNCKIPFLNGGLFDPINNYDWVNTEITIPDHLFSNNRRTKEGDIGDGILDVFDRFNFTVNEEEPLEKEVALDPELLGKIYEKLNAIRPDNFDEYVKVLKSGKRGEEAKFNKEYGVYYTPREIVHYMCQESLINYLETELKEKCPREDIEKFVKFADSIYETEEIAIDKEKKVKSGQQKTTKYESQLPDSIKSNAKEIDRLLADIKVCDPAVGSGAFPIGMMHEIVKLRRLLSLFTGEQRTNYELKRHCIENSLYGVDIDPGAVEICKLRFWLSLIVDEEDIHQIKPLPNLDYKVVCGNSLLGFPQNWGSEIEKNIENLMDRYFSETNPIEKDKLKKQIDEKIKHRLKQSERNFGYKINFDFNLFFPKVFREKDGFDVVIANPPYVSTKGVPEGYKKHLKKYYNFADDLYNHFYFKGMEICKNNGILTFISSKTFWTIQTKRNLRELLLKNKILVLFDTANPFEAQMVDTCIAIVQKSEPFENHKITFIDGRKDLNNPKKYSVEQFIYLNAPNKVFFIPSPYNLKIYEKFGKKVSELLEKWWDKISTSKNINKYRKELENYGKSLKIGDITLLGLITEGGQGLATGNNGKYIGVLEGTKWAEKVRKERSKKLWEFIQSKRPRELKHLNSKEKVEEYLNGLTEEKIRELFDKLKEKYGRDIFGQGWLYRIVRKDEIADVDSLTENEKLDGIKGKKTFVPYDKGDKEGNRWYAPTPYYIDWSRENVKRLQNDPKARWQGYRFYFREGFCWTFTLNEYSEYQKVRIKEKGIHDVNAMSLFPIISLSPKYIICLLNSYFLFYYKKHFINSSSAFQINDARQIPIIIPTPQQLKELENIFNRAYSVQKDKFAGKISKEEAERKLDEIQKNLDVLVEKMYMEK